MSARECYKDMCASLRKDGLSTEGMYVAYLHCALRESRERIRKLEEQC